jgi:hypothetical protein
LNEALLVVARLRDEGMLDLLHLLDLLALLDDSNWLSICSYVLDYFLLPNDLMNWLLIRYILVGCLNLDGNLPSSDFRPTEILLTLKLLYQTALNFTIIHSLISPHKASLRRSILRNYNILHLIS